MRLFKDRRAKAKEVTLIGAIFLIAIGIVFLSVSGQDPTKIILSIGLIFLLVGIVALIAILLKLFK